jgi:hypothetical protein
VALSRKRFGITLHKNDCVTFLEPFVLSLQGPERIVSAYTSGYKKEVVDPCLKSRLCSVLSRRSL